MFVFKPAQKLSLKSALTGYQPFPQKTINVRLLPGAKPLASPDVQAAQALEEKRLQGQGRLVLRASGTEPVVRVMVEGDDHAEVDRLTEELAETVRQAANA
mgnify:CR=1 FL=1